MRLVAMLAREAMARMVMTDGDMAAVLLYIMGVEAVLAVVVVVVRVLL